MTLADGGPQFLPGHGGQVFAVLVLVKPPFRRIAVADRKVGHVVPLALGRRVLVKTQQAAGQPGHRAAVFCAQAGPVAASLFDGLVKGSVGDVRTLALDNEPRHFLFVVGVNHQVGVVVGRPSRDVDLKADTLRPVLVLVDKLRPQLSADFLLGVRPPLRMTGGDIADALVAALAGDFGVAVSQGAGQQSLVIGSVGHGGNPDTVLRTPIYHRAAPHPGQLASPNRAIAYGLFNHRHSGGSRNLVT